MDDKWVVSIATGPSQLPLMMAAKSLGYKVIGVDQNPNSEFVDIPVPISTFSTQEVLDEFTNNKEKYPRFEGVLCRSSGPALHTANELAKLYGLKRFGDDVVKCSSSKISLFNWAKKNKVKSIDTLLLEMDSELPEQYMDMVIKPAEPVIGKENVYKINNLKDFLRAKKAACEESIDGRAICQPYIEGKDIGIACLCDNGELKRTSYYEELNVFVDQRVSHNGMYNLLPHELSEDINRQISDAARKIIFESMATGFIFMTFRVSDDKGVMLYEVNPGLCGDSLAEDVIASAWSDIDLFKIDVAAMSNELSSALNKCGIYSHG